MTQGKVEMKINEIKNELDHEAALRRVETILHASPGSREEEELEALVGLIEIYEDEHYPMAPDPIEE